MTLSALASRRPPTARGAGTDRARPLLRAVTARAEPWRDWAAIAVAAHGVLITLVVLQPGWPWLLLAAVLLGQIWSTGTLTVLHDAGHRRFARRAWPNVLAVQSAVPLGLWVGHWTLKHRVHHRATQVYPIDEATRSSGLVRLHASAPWRGVHRYQHWYAWLLYGLAWVGELRSQATYVRTGGVDLGAPSARRRAASFLTEKALCLLVLLPYAIGLGVSRLVVLLVVAMTVTSVTAAVITTVGHINVGLIATGSPAGEQWLGHIVATTASFSTEDRLARWLTGGLTHHLAHHLRPVADRAALPELHRTAVPLVAERAGATAVEFPTLASAVHGHWSRLRELGAPPQRAAGIAPRTRVAASS